MSDIVAGLVPDQFDVLSIIGVALALGTTIHILLRKRDVASSVGWIGLVWLTPLFGAICYLMFGVNRVQRRARRLRRQDDANRAPSTAPLSGIEGDLAALADGIGRITGRPLQAGTTVQTFENGDNAYPPMLAAIDAARHSVSLSSYIFQDDVWGRRFITALAAANARGVDVRVLIDGIGGGWLLSRAYHRLRREHVNAARFLHSWLPWRMPIVNLRSHKKVLIVDGTIGFTGGMNIADDNVMATRPKTPVQDLHFRIQGPVVEQLSDAFAQDWFFTTDEDLQTDPSGDGPAGTPGEPPDGSGTGSGPPGGGALARMIDSGPDEDLEKVEFAVLQAIACARASIVVMTPYFLPDERLVTALALAAMRRVAVDVIVPEKSDHVLVDWATRANIGPLLNDGVRLWRSPPPFHHSKMMVVDQAWCLIGSTNWDIRSFRLNFELCVEIYDRDLAATLHAIMHRVRGRALTQADLDARGLPTRLRDAAVRLMLPYL